MRSRTLLVAALASLLCAVPTLASAGVEATVPSAAWDGALVPIAAVVVTVTLAMLALLVTRRRAPQVPSAATEAAEDQVAATLQRRTLRRGRLRLDDEAMQEAGEAIAAAAPARPARRSG
jgi:membrane protein implicated in regulation of membrane protease activity